MIFRFLFIGLFCILFVAFGSAQVHHFAIFRDGGGPIPDTTAGIPLFIQIIAQDSLDGTVTSFSGTVDVASSGTLLTGGGMTAGFDAGTLTGHQVTFAGAGTVTITATETDGSAVGASAPFLVENPLPATSGISPSIKTAGEAGFTMTVSGTRFVASSQVLFGGLALTTTFVDTVTLSALVPAAAVDTAGSVAVTVVTPSPGGGSSNAQLFIVVPPVVNARIYLEGAFSGTAMTTTLRSGGFIPLAQPYGAAPWSYAGTELVGAIPAGVVDWVLVELRTGTSQATRVARRAAFLTSGGTIVDTGGGPVSFLGMGTGSYRIVIHHRNHLSVMSAAAAVLDRASALYDFTAAAAAAFGGDEKPLGGGLFALYAGDYSRDGFIDASDFIGPDNEVFLSGYRSADLNLDGFVDASDFLYPDNNVFIGTSVP
jgi:hypothetical protein